jgi:hypothetical protein
LGICALRKKGKTEYAHCGSESGCLEKINQRTYSGSNQTGGIVAKAHESHGSSPTDPVTVSALKVNIRGKR